MSQKSNKPKGRAKPRTKFEGDVALPKASKPTYGPRIEDVVKFDTAEVEPLKIIGLPPESAEAPESPKSVTLVPESEEELKDSESDAPFFAADAAKVAKIAEEALPTTRLMDAVPVVKVSPTVLAIPLESEHDASEDARDSDGDDSERPSITARRRAALKKRMKRRREHVRTFSHIVGSLLLVAFIITTASFASHFLVRAFLDFTGITVNEVRASIEIPSDASTEEIADILYDHEIIAMPGLFVRYARLTDNDGEFLNGLHNFRSSMSYSQIIFTLQNRPRSNETVTVTIPEGLTAREIGELLEENQVCRAEDFAVFYRSLVEEGRRFEFQRRLEHDPLRFNQLEGFLFPDTYEFFVVNGLDENPNMDTSAEAEVAARTLLRNFNANMSQEIYWRIGELNATLPFDFRLPEFVTLASMVQWEAATPEDMQLVASVFLNRLRSPNSYPHLQSDVTRRYANESIEPYRTASNAQFMEAIITSFDTHATRGLPPGPVNNPGMTAMLAVLDAPSTGYFFFCSNIDTRETFFAETYAQHQRNLLAAGLIDEQGNQIFR